MWSRETQCAQNLVDELLARLPGEKLVVLLKYQIR